MGGSTAKLLMRINPLLLGPTAAGVRAIRDPQKARTRAIEEAAAQATEDALAIEKRAAEAEATADLVAKEAARKKLRAQTQTIFTSGLGVLGAAPTKKTTLGAN